VSEQYFIRKRGKIDGPFTFDRLSELKSQGRLTRIHELSTDGRNWTSASEFSELFGRGQVALEVDSKEVSPDEDLLSIDVGELRVNGLPPQQKEREWYYAINDEQFGPVPETALREKIKEGEVGKRAKVWTDGMPDWSFASQTEELAPCFWDNQSSPSAGPIKESKNKVVAGLLALFLGVMGVHRFYLGQWWGIVYPVTILIFALAIPLQFGAQLPRAVTLISLAIGYAAAAAPYIEALIIFCTSEDAWRQKYGA